MSFDPAASEPSTEQELLGLIDQHFTDNGPRETPLATPATEATPAAVEPTPTTPNTPAATESSEGEPTLESQLADLSRTYGVPASELAGFTSADEAEAELRDYLNNIAQQGREFGQPQQQPHPGQQQPLGADAPFQQPPSQQPPVQLNPQQPAWQLQAPPQIDLSQLEEDHPLRAQLQAQADYNNFLHQQMQQVHRTQEEIRFANQQRESQLLQQQCAETLTQLSPTRYGTAEQQNMFQQQKQSRVIEHAAALANGFALRNIPVPPVRSLLEMADRALFHTEIQKEQLRNRETARSAQNGARLGRPNAASRVADDYDDSVPFEDQPALHALYYEMEQQGA